MPEQPPPTLAEIAEFHRDMARGLHQSCPDDWHEAAARRIDALAGQGRDAALIAWLWRRIHGLNRQAKAADDADERCCLLAEAVALSDLVPLIERGEHVAAPPAEEPRGWIAAPGLPPELEGVSAWRWMGGRLDLVTIPHGYDRRPRACGGVWFWPLPEPEPPAEEPREGAGSEWRRFDYDMASDRHRKCHRGSARGGNHQYLPKPA